MPSLAAEGFGVSILEAIFRNTPIVYTSGGGMDEFLYPILPEFRYDFNDPKQLEIILEKLIVLKRDNMLNLEKIKIEYNFKNGIDKILAQ
jgi:glycosyltransferase involved in cell wall biosynthesis